MIKLNHQCLLFTENLWERDALASACITSYTFPMCYKKLDSGKSGQILGGHFNDCLLFRTHFKALLRESE